MLYGKRKFEIDINNDDYFGNHIRTYGGGGRVRDIIN